MKTFLKPLFDILTGDVAICDNILYNYIVMLIVGELAFRLAWNLVGDMYHIGLISSKESGSFFHWTARLISYVCCAYLIRGVIWLYKFIVAVPHWAWWIVAGIIAAVIAAIMSVMLLRKRGGHGK